MSDDEMVVKSIWKSARAILAQIDAEKVDDSWGTRVEGTVMSAKWLREVGKVGNNEY
jgi:hypothetical protein